MTAVGCAVMEAMVAPGFLPQVAATGAYLSERLQELVGEFGLSHERGWGLLRALDLGAPGAGRAWPMRGTSSRSIRAGRTRVSS